MFMDVPIFIEEIGLKVGYAKYKGIPDGIQGAKG